LLRVGHMYAADQILSWFFLFEWLVLTCASRGCGAWSCSRVVPVLPPETKIQ